MITLFRKETYTYIYEASIDTHVDCMTGIDHLIMASTSTSLRDVAGLDNVKQIINESLILPLKYPTIFTGYSSALRVFHVETFHVETHFVSLCLYTFIPIWISI